MRRSAEGASASIVAAECNAKFHGGREVRTVDRISLKRSKLGVKVQRTKGMPKPQGEDKEQEVKQTRHADGSLDILAVGRRIRTVEDAIAYVEADMGAFEIAKVESTAWDVTLVDPATKKARTVQNHRVFVQLRPKSGPSTEDRIAAILDGAFATRKPLPTIRTTAGNADILQGIVIADPHIGKLAWGDSTGGEHYDTSIAVDTLRRGVSHLTAVGNERKVGARHLWLLGDFFHHDGQGTTSGGTVMEYDSRVQKMLRDGSEVLFDLIAASAATVPTTVVLVPGNHDRTLTWALQRILVSEFRRHKGVTIDDSSTGTKFLTHGRCLIGLDHGDRGKKRLHETMAALCEVEWAQSICREIHTGHLHSRAAIRTDGGVVIHTHDSLGAPDQYHADEKFNTAPRTIAAFRYHRGGICEGSDSWSPDLNRAPRRGARAA